MDIVTIVSVLKDIMTRLLDVIMKYRTGILRLTFCFILVAGVYVFDYHCPILTYLKIPCLGCGMSRAWKAAIHGQFVKAFEYHRAFWTVPFICFFILKGSLFRKKLYNFIIISVISISFIINYLYHYI